MAKFTDKDGREWTVEITHGHVGPLRRDLGLDLKDVLREKDNPLADVVGDPERFGQLLWLLCGREAAAAGITPEEFGYRFNGPVAEAATAAVYEAVLEYFPYSRKSAKRVGTSFREAMAETRDAADRAIGAELSKLRTDLTSKLSGLSSAGSAGSTPGP